MAKVSVHNGNIDQALMSIRKKLQRDQVFVKIKERLRFVSKNKKRTLKKVDGIRRRIRKKMMKMRQNDD